MIVYGELYGGFFPEAGADRAAVVAARIDSKTGRCKVPLEGRAVQEGIYYSAKLEFMAFDVAYCWSDGPRYLRFLTSAAFERLAAALRSPRDFRFARTLLRTRHYGEVSERPR